MEKYIEQEQWDTVIESDVRLFDLKLRDVWHYRDLLLLLVKRDFVSFYKQTVLGPLWFFIQPIFTTATYTLVFGRLAGISTDGINGPLFYMAGITAWNYFSDCLLKTSTVFRDNANVFGKVYFPRLIMPLSIVMSSLIRFGIQMLMFLLMMAFFALKGDHTFHLTSYVFLFPILVIQMALLGLGAGMIVSAMTNKYRDLALLLSFGIQLAMYSTTVILPLSYTHGKNKLLQTVISLNPLTPVLEAFRYGFLGAGTFSWTSLTASFVATILITLSGIIIFNKIERSFIDTV